LHTAKKSTHGKGSFAVLCAMTHGKGCFAVHQAMPHGKVCAMAAQGLLCRASSLCRAPGWIVAVRLLFAVRFLRPLPCVFLCRVFFLVYAVRERMPCVVVSAHGKDFFAVWQRTTQ
jgi:hypothetical protein